MKKLLLFAAAISALTLPGAFACEYGHQAANPDRTTVTCSGGNCQAIQPTAANAPTNEAGRVDEVVQETCTGANCERAQTSLVSLRPADLANSNDK
jgi:hypothetical protein